MHMPGFTAEASLSKTDKRYHMGEAGRIVPQKLPQTVSPQWLGLLTPTISPVPNPWSRIPNCGPDGVLICYQGHCSCW